MIEEKIEQLRQNINDSYLLTLEILGDSRIKEYRENFIDSLHWTIGQLRQIEKEIK